MILRPPYDARADELMTLVACVRVAPYPATRLDSPPLFTNGLGPRCCALFVQAGFRRLSDRGAGVGTDGDSGLRTNAMNSNTTTAVPTEPARLAFSVQETAQMLGVCDKSVRRLILRGLLRPSRALRHILIPTIQFQDPRPRA